MINPDISEAEWKKCKAEIPELSVDKDTWMDKDLSTDRKHGSMFAAN
jgi:hypothetical protein